MRFVRFHIASWVADAHIWPVLLEMGEVVVGAQHPDPTLTGTRWMERRVENAFKRGTLLLVQEDAAPSGVGGGGGAGAGSGAAQQPAPPAEIPAPPRAPDTSSKTWFHAKLIDENGQPIAGEDYILVDTDGATRKGKLDAQGEVYIPSILPPGKCTITFPNIHLNYLKKK